MEPLRRLAKALGSLPLAIACLAWLMVLVAACTVAQIRLGNYAAVRLFIDSAFLRWRGIPVLPAGGATGAALLVNLACAQLARLEPSWRKAGLWLTHLGLIVLFVGQFVSAAFQAESQMVLREGQGVSFMQSLHDTEFFAAEGGREIADPAAWPFELRVEESGSRPEQADAPATPWKRVRVLSGGWTLGRPVLESGGAPVEVSAGGRKFLVGLRPRREKLPFTLTLRQFIHKTYPGTDIPRTFASVIALDNPGSGERRDVVISMNDPLRYAGRAFYQASFDEDGAVSVLQVVRNPGWTLPYVACALVAAGLLLHFLGRLRPGKA